MTSSRHPGLSGTERADERFRGLDTWDSASILTAMLEDQRLAVAAVAGALAAIAAAAEAAVPRLDRGGRLVLAGAGTSGRVAVQDGVELTPTFGWPADRLTFLLAGGEAALTRAIEGAEDDADAAIRATDAAGVGPDDVAIGLAASGTTPFTVAAVARARNRGALTIGFANNPGTPLLHVAECAVLLETGPEAIAGSTRMKAGTAQKIALNLFSSLVMVRLGRVYEGHMVELRATNRKLLRRSERMLSDLTGCSPEAACAALAACGGRVKPAILVAHGLTPAAAEALLAAVGGNVRSAISRLAAPGGAALPASDAARPSSAED